MTRSPNWFGNNILEAKLAKKNVSEDETKETKTNHVHQNFQYYSINSLSLRYWWLSEQYYLSDCIIVKSLYSLIKLW